MPEAITQKRKMKQQRRNFRTDTEAVSEVIGMVLLLAILVTFFTLIQVSVVPAWNKKVEADHIPAVYDDMTSLSSDISDSASRAIAKSSSIQLGARYPDRMIFLNPGPGAFGTLTVENDVAVNVVCTDGDGDVTSRNYNTSRLIYDLTGTANSPKLVYEHGIIIREWDDILVNTSNITGYVSVDDKIKINSTEMEKIFLPVIDDVISSDLYTGMITGSATLEGGLWVSGEGTDIMAMGSRVANVPSSNATTAIVAQDFVVDMSLADKRNNDFVAITVTDYNGNWWKAEMLFLKTNQIKAIYLRSGNGASQNLTDFSFIDYPTVDLFDLSKFTITDGAGGMYQNASVGSNNRLVTLVGDSQNMVDNALISFRLMWDDD